MEEHEELADILRQLNKESSGVSAKDILEIVQSVLSEIDDYEKIVDSVVDTLAPKLTKYVERFEDYCLDREIKAIQKLTEKTTMSNEAAADYVLRRKKILADQYSQIGQNISKK